MSDKQTGRRIKISTVLDNPAGSTEDDPLLPAVAQCSEAFSTPYYIDLMMYASTDLEIKPQRMINTAATVSIRIENFKRDAPLHAKNTATYQQRKGVFQSFQRQNRFHRFAGKDFNVYTARLVPAFLIMDQEVRYRIFEQPNMDFTTVLNACMKSFKGLNLASYVDTAGLVKNPPDPPPPMEHCVQYGESTYNFLSRLMNRFSIWYYFDHDRSPKQEVLVLGTGPMPNKVNPGFCSAPDNVPDPQQAKDRLLLDSWKIVTGLSHIYTPAPRLTRTSDFNTMVPTNPIESNDDDPSVHADAKRDIINAGTGTDKAMTQCVDGLPTTTFIQESFPDSTINTDADATSDAATTMQVAEGQVFTVSATTKNASFAAAKMFTLKPGFDNPTDVKFVITRMSCSAYDRSYLYNVNHDSSLTALIDDVLVGPVSSLLNQISSTGIADLANALSQAGLQEYTSNWVETPPSQRDPFYVYFAAGSMAYLTTLLPTTMTVLQDILGILSSVVSAVLNTVVTLIGGIADIGLLLANPLLNLLGVHNSRQTLHKWVAEAHADIKKILENLLIRDDDGCGVSFVAEPIDSAAPIGPPLPVARNAQVFGPHLATVIGKNGVSLKDGEIWADSLGRVRVRFPWDRTPWDGLQTKSAAAAGSVKSQFNFGGNTAWLRVSEAWGGQKFGTQFTPRIGQEVVVSYIDGDPDRPIITGRVYNVSGGGTTNLPFPAAASSTTMYNNFSDILTLSKSASTDFARSGIETRSTPLPRDKDGNQTKPAGYHLLRFDDSYGNEQFLLRSQGRMDTTSKASSYVTTNGDRHVLCTAGKDPQGNTTGGSLFTTTGLPHFGEAPKGNYDLHVGGGRYEQVDGPDGYQLTVKKDMQMSLEQNWTGVVQGVLSLSASSIVLQAAQKITLKVGGTTIVINSGGVWSDGPLVADQQNGPADKASAVTMKDVLDATQADPGEPAGSRSKSSSSGGGSGGGGGENRGQTVVMPPEAIESSMSPDDMLGIPI